MLTKCDPVTLGGQRYIFDHNKNYGKSYSDTLETACKENVAEYNSAIIGINDLIELYGWDMNRIKLNLLSEIVPDVTSDEVRSHLRILNHILFKINAANFSTGRISTAGYIPMYNRSIWVLEKEIKLAIKYYKHILT